MDIDGVPAIVSKYHQRFSEFFGKIHRDRHTNSWIPSWEYSKHIGAGDFGYVTLEESPRGDQRAVKHIPLKESMVGEEFENNKACLRELEVLFTLSEFEKNERAGLFLQAFGWCVANRDEYGTSALDHGPPGKELSIAMEYCELGDLETFASGKAIEKRDLLMIFHQMAKGMAYMHSKGYTHRDFRPKNILVKPGSTDYHQPNWNIRIADFGLSKCIQDLTGKSDARGVNWYMSPELARHKFEGTAEGINYFACDAWALGISIFVLLTGKPPFLELAKTTHPQKRREAFADARVTLEDVKWYRDAKPRWKSYFDYFLFELLEPDPLLRMTPARAESAMKNEELFLSFEMSPEHARTEMTASHEQVRLELLEEKLGKDIFDTIRQRVQREDYLRYI